MEPRVFEDGAVTVVAGPGGCRVYVGAVELGHLGQLLVELGPAEGPPQVKLVLRRGTGEEDRLRIDEELRIVKSVPWIEVVR